MANIIDALVVTLGLDSSNYQKGQKEVDEGLDKLKENAGSTAKEMELRGKQAAVFVSAIKTELIGLFALVTAGKGLTSFISDSISGTAALGRFAANLNMSARDLDGWGKAAELFGGTAEGVRGSLQNIAGGIQQFALTGESELIPIFRSLGVAVSDSSGKVRDYREIMLDVADKFKGMSGQEALSFGKMLGLDDGTITLLRKGRQAVEDVVAQTTKASGVTQQSVEASQRVQRELALVRQQFEGVGQSIYESLGPALEMLSGDLGKFSTWVSEHREEIQGFFTGLVTAVEKLAKVFRELDTATDGNSTKIIAATSALWLLSSALGAVGAGMKGIIGLGASFGSTLALTGAGYAGWRAGEQINERLSAGTKDTIGSLVAHIAALLGVKEAQDAIKINEGLAVPGESSVSTGTVYRAGDKTLPRGVRNNNPGNLNFAGQNGATKEEGPNGRFAKFSTMEEGVGALVKQLRRYEDRGDDTLRAIINKYAPSSENNTGAYMSTLSKQLGVGYDQKLDQNDTKQLMALVKGIINHENGSGYVSDSQISAGVRLGARARASTTNNTASTSTSETTIGKIEIHTQATDAQGIARDIAPALGNSLANQAATGDS
ncbi:hypothetical protein HX776_24435 [Pseudomonas agarici]|uniref:hypothetical protein n=1 Tax=Pseudomonas agarici TaxID=46677 RepID=UPI000300F272|nr:hypothetical protein [Pseudomonas agarici]NWC11939.1 hypothetical protein [Pseudomonas agarici]SEL85675.1 hypothetical protein SAMN05216604_14026 [Pseudomonas agarici]